MPFNIIRNDITKVEADAIVNTANYEPAVGDGVDSAIYKAAGWDKLLAEREKIGRIEPGEARATDGFDLPAKYIIHTVGPVWQGGGKGEQETLAKCYRNSLTLAEQLGCDSVAFPLISTGTFGFPKDLALSTAISEIGDFLLEHDIDVILVVYNKEAFMLSGRIFSDVKSYIEESDVLVREHYGLDRARMSKAMPEFAGNVSFGRAKPDTRSGKIKAEEALKELEGEAEPSAEEAERAEIEADMLCDEVCYEGAVDPDELDHFISSRGETFQQKLFHMIDHKKLDDRDVYKRSNIDRKLFSKIKSNVDYSPSKKTVFAFAIGMHLNLDETVDLLRSAGMAFSPGIVFDRIIEYCIAHEYYNIVEINCILFDNGQPILGE